MSIKINFIRLKKSQMIVENINNRIVPILRKFNIDELGEVKCEVSMLNSKLQLGPDLFKFKFYFKLFYDKEIIVEKSDDSFYGALALVSKALPVKIKKITEKKSTKSINLNRKLKRVASL
jgi:ribosome-associated translation inhibitor RaiA